MDVNGLYYRVLQYHFSLATIIHHISTCGTISYLHDIPHSIPNALCIYILMVSTDVIHISQWPMVSG